MAGMGMKILDLNNSGSGVTASATANTPGAWQQVITSSAISSSETICSLAIQAIGNNQQVNTDNSMLLDIGKGAAGSETIVASNIAIGGLNNGTGQGPFVILPVRIEGATRVAFRVRAAVGSRVMTLTSLLTSGQAASSSIASRLPTSLDTIGTSTSTSAGTAMSGSSGTWVQITSATSVDYQALVLVPSGPFSTSGLSGNTTYQLTLGIGPSGSEVELAYAAGFYGTYGQMFPYPLSAASAIYGGFIPAGTRIAVKHNIASNPQNLCACVIGVPYV